MPSRAALGAGAVQGLPRRARSACCRHQRGGALVVQAAAGRQGQQPDPYAVLQVARGSSRREIRKAYIGRIKLLHPDVSASGDDTTLEAASVNAAYERLMEGFDSNSRAGDDSDDDFDPLDVFDFPEAEPSQLFVDPWACYNVSPMQWEAVQELGAAAAAAGRDPWMALREAGVQCGEGAFVWLTPAQLALVREEMERASVAMDATAMQAAAAFVGDCLLRARVANNRVPARPR